MDGRLLFDPPAPIRARYLTLCFEQDAWLMLAEISIDVDQIGIPALGGWGLVLFALVLAGAGWGVLGKSPTIRRRTASTSTQDVKSADFLYRLPK